MIKRALATTVVLGGLLAFFLFRMEGLTPFQLVHGADTTDAIRAVILERERAYRAHDGRAYCATYALEEQRDMGEGNVKRCPSLVRFVGRRPSLARNFKVHVVRHFFDVSMNGALADARIVNPDGHESYSGDSLVRRGGHWRFFDYECRVHKTGCGG